MGGRMGGALRAVAAAAALFAPSSCGDFADGLEADLSSTYTFVDGSGRSASRSYRIGRTLSAPDPSALADAVARGLPLPPSSLPSSDDGDVGSWREGHRVDGWRWSRNPLSGSTEVPGTVSVSGGSVSSLTVTPQPAELEASSFSPVTYRVSFVPRFTPAADGDVASMPDFVMTWGESAPLPACTMSRSGCEFAGWLREDSDATSPDLADRAEAVSLGSRQGEVVPLYAVWIAREIRISFDPNGGSGTMGARTYSFANAGTESLPANAFTREGYIFCGWSSSTNGRTYSDREVLGAGNWPNGDATMTAQWRPRATLVEGERTLFSTSATGIEFSCGGSGAASWGSDTGANGSGGTFSLGYGSLAAGTHWVVCVLQAESDGIPRISVLKFVFTVE